MKKILIITNSINGLYSFRKELIEELLKRGFEINISAPKNLKTNFFEENGCNMIATEFNRRGKNPILDFKLLSSYFKVIKDIRPHVVLTYTIKPNIYGGIICRLLRIPHLPNITGLGTAIENKGILQKITLILYRIGLKHSQCIFYQNQENLEFMHLKNKIGNTARLIPGSGVNIEEHIFEKYPLEVEPIKFLFIGRLMRAKGIDELFNTIKIIKKRYPKVEFHFLGSQEEDYQEKINILIKDKLIIYHGRQNNVHNYIKKSHAVINPSHHEGMSNVLLEAASTGRPVIASDIPGCREIFDDGISGFKFVVKNVDSLNESIIKFIELSFNEKVEMGHASRRKVKNEFNRKIVIKAYLEEIEKVVGGINSELV